MIFYSVLGYMLDLLQVIGALLLMDFSRTAVVRRLSINLKKRSETPVNKGIGALIWFEIFDCAT